MWNISEGIRQFYTDNGNNDGIPIIFIHGFPFDHRTWAGQVKVLPSRFRAITYDIRGHGQSEAGNGCNNIEFFIDDLFALIDFHSLDKIILSGLSMGGYIALRAFERHPDVFKGLILCDTRSEADGNEAKIKRASAIKDIEKNGVIKYAEDSLKNLFWEENIKAMIPAVNQVSTTILNTSEAVLCGTLMALAARTDTTHVLETINIPTLIIVGEHDVITPPIAAESLHEAIKGSELMVIKNAGHLSNLENPEDFNLALLQFLDKMQ